MNRTPYTNQHKRNYHYAMKNAALVENSSLTAAMIARAAQLFLAFEAACYLGLGIWLAAVQQVAWLWVVVIVLALSIILRMLVPLASIRLLQRVPELCLKKRSIQNIW